MNNAADLIERYLAGWNEADAERRRDLIAQTWIEDARYVDPLMEGVGHAGIDAMIAGAQAQFAGLRFRRAGNVDVHHDCVRFSWELAPEGSETAVLAAGTDFGILARDGRLQSVTGFLDVVPSAARPQE